MSVPWKWERVQAGWYFCKEHKAMIMKVKSQRTGERSETVWSVAIGESTYGRCDDTLRDAKKTAERLVAQGWLR